MDRVGDLLKVYMLTDDATNSFTEAMLNKKASKAAPLDTTTVNYSVKHQLIVTIIIEY